MTHRIILGDCLDVLPTIKCDLIFTSPPYEDARTYGIDFVLKGDDWVQWAADRYMACLDACSGLVAWVVAGRTQKYEWTATPALLMVELKRRGAILRNPPIYKRNGIPGSGGPDWLRADYEWIICATRERGKLPWSDNTAMGHAPKFGPGGAPSHRLHDGTRVTAKLQTRRKPDGTRKRDGLYKPPALSNPGNIIDCGAAGGGNIGDKLAHENEAPFPERLAEFFVRSFCPPGGTVCDPFSGSGTTAKVALAHGRNAIAIDVRESQVDLTGRRLKQEATQ